MDENKDIHLTLRATRPVDDAFLAEVIGELLNEHFSSHGNQTIIVSEVEVEGETWKNN